MRLRNPETGKGAPFWRSLSKALKTYSKVAPSYNVFPRAKINSAISSFPRHMAAIYSIPKSFFRTASRRRHKVTVY